MAKLSINIIFLLYLAVVHTAPKKEQVSTRQNKDTIQPVYVPGRCPQNQMLYPGDQTDEWVCDCGPRFLYYSPQDKCYPIYRKGPCRSNEYFIILQNKTQAECASNPCTKDGLVPFKGGCPTLHSSSPCPPANSGQVLSVNPTTLELSCVEGGSQLNIIVPGNSCPRGSKRSSSGQCRREFPVTD